MRATGYKGKTSNADNFGSKTLIGNSRLHVQLHENSKKRNQQTGMKRDATPNLKLRRSMPKERAQKPFIEALSPE
jgi:hypothetical protein